MMGYRNHDKSWLALNCSVYVYCIIAVINSIPNHYEKCPGLNNKLYIHLKNEKQEKWER